MFLLTLIFISSTLQENIVTADSLYREKNYEDAIGIYSDIINRGIRDPFVYYNLGNCYFKSGDVGRAILCYKRAKKLSPGDADIEFNLNFARTQRIDVLEVTRRPKFVDFIVNFPGRFPVNMLVIFSSGFFFLIFILLSLSLFYKKKIFHNINTGVFILLICSLLMLYTNIRRRGVEEGVLLDTVQAVRSGPGKDYSLIFTLHEGAEFRILEEEDGWCRVGLQPGLMGWVKEESFERV